MSHILPPNFCRSHRRHITRRLYRWIYSTVLVTLFTVSAFVFPHWAHSFTPDTECMAELDRASSGNRSFEILNHCLDRFTDPTVERGEIQRRLALMEYDRIGATGKDKAIMEPRSLKVQQIENRIDESLDIARATGYSALMDRSNYTLGQIRVNEIDRNLRLLKVDSVEEMQVFQSKIRQTLLPLSQSKPIQAKLYQTRVLTTSLPILYRAIEVQSQAVLRAKKQYESDARTALDAGSPLTRVLDPEPQAKLDRLSQQTRIWTTDLLTLLPQLQSSIVTDPEVIALSMYHATTLTKLPPVRSALNQLETARQTEWQAERQMARQTPSNQLYEPFLPMTLQTQLAQESDRADRQAADLFLTTIRSTRNTQSKSPEESKTLRKQSLQATLALARLYEQQNQPDIAARLLTPELLLEADAIDSPEIAGLLYGRYAHLQSDRLKCKQLGTKANLNANTNANVNLDASVNANSILNPISNSISNSSANARDCAAVRQASDTAIRRIELVRGDLLSLSPDLQYSYREGVEPLYRDNLELQLVQANPDLESVLARMESLKLAEVHNYFREPCVEPKVQLTRFINQNLPNTNLIYTIALQDRLEIIVKLAGNSQDLHRYQSTVSRKTLEATVKAFKEKVVIENLPNSAESQALYNWIFRSIDAATGRTLESDLQPESTLVMVSDSGLREIPMAALYDGKQSLIDRFAVALSPGLTLFDPKPVRKPNVMFAGQTVFIRSGLNPLPGTKVELLELQQDQFLPTQSPSQQVLMSEEESPYLPFTLANFETAIAQKGFNVVHLATHASFGSAQDQTYIVMGDEKVGTDAFSEALRKRDRTREDSLELLILSACQTAEGDDRAVLGLSGLAIRSGARSTIATLWNAADAADVTPKVMRQFYQGVFTRQLTKAQALRQAQLTLKAQQPSSLWAPYVVVGNWL